MATCIIFNPAARGTRAAQLRDQLASLSEQCTLKPTYAAGSGRALGAEAVEEGFDTIVAAGGDGTVHEVLNGIGSVAGAFERTRFGVIPVGTINVFAKDMGLPDSIDEAWTVILKGNERLIDLPCATRERNPGQPERHYFVQLGGAGLDSRAIEKVDMNQKKRYGPLAYVIAGFKAFHDRHPRIVASGPKDGAMGELILVGNGRYYGGRFDFFPEARYDDGLLDVLVFPKVNWPVLFEVGWGWITRQLHTAGGAISFQTDHLTLTSEDPVPLELDGENVSDLPVTVTLEPKTLKVLAP